LRVDLPLDLRADMLTLLAATFDQARTPASKFTFLPGQHSNDL
jgi:hypothetical protein